MKKHIYSVIAFAVLATSAFASPATEMDLKVPFAFKAGASVMPAGTYKVTDATAGYFLIRNEKSGVFVPKSAFIPDMDESGNASVKFSLSGGHYILQSAASQK